MKRILLILASALLALAAAAQERSVEAAETIAKDFFASAPATKASAVDLRMVWDGTTPETRSSSEKPAFYLFANASGPGFVIVSGDDRARTILGYSYENEIDPDNLPPHFVSWMMNIGAQIRCIAETSAPVTKSATKSDIDVGQEVKLLETARWNQGEPYNEFCPDDVSTGKRSVVGCVATATAIVMRYHKWPEAGRGTTPAYTIESTGLSVPSNELGEYNWDNMPLSFPKSGYSLTQAKEVAKLMLDCGTMIKMNYSSSASSASTGSVAAALQTYMQYDGATGTYNRGVYSEEKWHSMLEEQINEIGPIIYSGQSDFGGHCFVLDGYTTKNYYHVNWGWSGSSDGWYSLDGMNPGEPGIGGAPDAFNKGQYAVFNARKEAGGVQEVRALLGEYKGVKGLQADRTVFEPGVPFKLSTGLLSNPMTINYVGEMGFAVADRDENIIEIIHRFETNLRPGYGYYFVDREFTFTTDLDFGYQLIAIIWNYQTNKWDKIRSNREHNNPDFIPLFDQYTIEECTNFSFNTDTRDIVIAVKEGVNLALYDSAGNDISSSVVVGDKKATISTKSMAPGKYRVVLTKGEEYKEFDFVTGEKEVTNE